MFQTTNQISCVDPTNPWVSCRISHLHGPEKRKRTHVETSTVLEMLSLKPVQLEPG